MKIVYAPDALGNSLPAVSIVSILEKKGRKYFPECNVVKVPISDGDKGVLDALCPILGGKICSTRVQNYMGERTEVKYGLIGTDTMIIESSLLLYEENRLDIPIRRKLLHSSTAGVGELIAYGLERGCRRFYIGAGKSFAFDGGMGCTGALGARFYNDKKELIEPCGANLLEVRSVDVTGLDPRLSEAEITLMCSVTNVLSGEEGAVYVYGALSGGGPDELLMLEKGMKNFSWKLEEVSKQNLGAVEGLGAAGGMPAGLLALCDGKIRSGVSTIMKLIDFNQILDGAELVIVGEEKLNRMSVYGKTVSGIGTLCKAKGIPVVALASQIEPGAESAFHYGVTAMFGITNRCMTESQMTETAKELLSETADNIFRLLRIGMQINKR